MGEDLGSGQDDRPQQVASEPDPLFVELEELRQGIPQPEVVAEFIARYCAPPYNIKSFAEKTGLGRSMAQRIVTGEHMPGEKAYEVLGLKAPPGAFDPKRYTDGVIRGYPPRETPEEVRTILLQMVRAVGSPDKFAKANGVGLEQVMDVLEGRKEQAGVRLRRAIFGPSGTAKRQILAPRDIEDVRHETLRYAVGRFGGNATKWADLHVAPVSSVSKALRGGPISDTVLSAMSAMQPMKIRAIVREMLADTTQARWARERSVPIDRLRRFLGGGEDEPLVRRGLGLRPYAPHVVGEDQQRQAEIGGKEDLLSLIPQVQDDNPNLGGGRDIQAIPAKNVEVYRIDELPEDVVEAIATAKMDPEHDHLNALMGRAEDDIRLPVQNDEPTPGRIAYEHWVSVADPVPNQPFFSWEDLPEQSKDLWESEARDDKTAQEVSPQEGAGLTETPMGPVAWHQQDLPPVAVVAESDGPQDLPGQAVPEWQETPAPLPQDFDIGKAVVEAEAAGIALILKAPGDWTFEAQPGVNLDRREEARLLRPLREGYGKVATYLQEREARAGTPSADPAPVGAAPLTSKERMSVAHTLIEDVRAAGGDIIIHMNEGIDPEPIIKKNCTFKLWDGLLDTLKLYRAEVMVCLFAEMHKAQTAQVTTPLQDVPYNDALSAADQMQRDMTQITQRLAEQAANGLPAQDVVLSATHSEPIEEEGKPKSSFLASISLHVRRIWKG